MKQVVIPTTPLTSRTGQLVRRMVIKDIWRLTSNWTGGLNILSVGLDSVYPLNGIDQEHKIHPFHPSCTRIAPKIICFIIWIGGSISDLFV